MQVISVVVGMPRVSNASWLAGRQTRSQGRKVDTLGGAWRVDSGPGCDARGFSNTRSCWSLQMLCMTATDHRMAVCGPSRVGSPVELTWDDGRIKDEIMSMSKSCARANCESKGQTCKGKPVLSLFGRNWGQRAGWWWSWAGRKVVVCHVGLVVDGSCHCVEMKLKLG